MKHALLTLLAVTLVSCSDTPPAPVPPADVPAEASKVRGGDVAVSQQVKKKPQPAPAAIKPGKITALEMGQLFTMMQSDRIYLIDVRPPIIYRLGHIDGAINFPVSKYETLLPEHLPQIKQAIASGKVVVFYCQNTRCPDGYKTAMKFIKLGHTVSIYRGGWGEWKRAGLQ